MKKYVDVGIDPNPQNSVEVCFEVLPQRGDLSGDVTHWDLVPMDAYLVHAYNGVMGDEDYLCFTIESSHPVFTHGIGELEDTLQGLCNEVITHTP